MSADSDRREGSALSEGLGAAAWWARAENGNIRVWTSAEAEALRLAKEVGFPLEALYTRSQLDAALAAERELAVRVVADILEAAGAHKLHSSREEDARTLLRLARERA